MLGMSQADDLRDAIRSAVQSGAEELRRRLREPDGNTSEAPSSPDPFEGQTILLLAPGDAESQPPEPEAGMPVPETANAPEELSPLPSQEAELPTFEDRRALETALGLGEAPSPAPVADLEALVQKEMKDPGVRVQAPVSRAVEPLPSAPPAASPPVPSAPVAWAARALIFSWTALIRLLTIFDRAVPDSLRAQKTLLGKMGVALVCAATLGLIVLALMRLWAS